MQYAACYIPYIFTFTFHKVQNTNQMKIFPITSGSLHGVSSQIELESIWYEAIHGNALLNNEYSETTR